MKKYYPAIVLICCLAIGDLFGQANRNGYNSVLHQPPEADFSWNHTCYGDTTTFINASIRANTYTWTIYNKGLTKIDSSNAINLSFYFPSIDTFYVRLDADNGHPASSYQTVIIDSALTADFSFMHCSNEFLSHSTCVDSLFWQFGDGATSNAALPVHEYADTGYYNVTLIAYKGNTSDTVTKQIFADPQAFPTGLTTWHLGHDTLFVHAVDSMAGMFYNWNFGMGIHMYKRDTFYILPDTGTYIINFGDWNTCNTMYAIDTVRYYNTVSGISHNHQPQITLFPNPTQGDITINGLSSEISLSQVSLFNAVGEEVSRQSYDVALRDKSLRIRCPSVSNGFYHIRIRSENSVFNLPFLINK